MSKLHFTYLYRLCQCFFLEMVYSFLVHALVAPFLDSTTQHYGILIQPMTSFLHQLRSLCQQVPITFLIFPTRIQRTTDTRTYCDLSKCEPRNTTLRQVEHDPGTAAIYHCRCPTLTPEFALKTLRHSRCLRSSPAHTVDDSKNSALKR